jgi:ankyrin repeat protein
MKTQLLAGITTVCWISGQAIAQEPSSFFEALRQGDTAKLRTAIRAGADVNSRDTDGNTLLMQAAVYATAADLEFLLVHGADANARNKAGCDFADYLTGLLGTGTHAMLCAQGEEPASGRCAHTIGIIGTNTLTALSTH